MSSDLGFLTLSNEEIFICIYSSRWSPFIITSAFAQLLAFRMKVTSWGEILVNSDWSNSLSSSCAEAIIHRSYFQAWQTSAALFIILEPTCNSSIVLAQGKEQQWFGLSQRIVRVLSCNSSSLSCWDRVWINCHFPRKFFYSSKCYITDWSYVSTDGPGCFIGACSNVRWNYKSKSQWNGHWLLLIMQITKQTVV